MTQLYPLCEKCGSKLELRPIPCPDANPACVLVHYDYQCPACAMSADVLAAHRLNGATKALLKAS